MVSLSQEYSDEFKLVTTTRTVGNGLGRGVGSSVGSAVGCSVGRAVGSSVGSSVGSAVGSSVGSAVGCSVGSAVGVGVDSPDSPDSVQHGAGAGLASTTMTKGNPPRLKAAMRPRRNHDLLEELPVFRVDAPIDWEVTTRRKESNRQ